VLPMPYVDEGANLNFDIPVYELPTGKLTATIDTYLVNGIEGDTSGLQFYQSRDIVDNNHQVAGGGRITLGGPYVRAGTSVTSGRYNDTTSGTFKTGLDYTIWGYDIQARYKDLIRLQAEYARRDSDRPLTPGAANPNVFKERVDGCYAEGEVRPWHKCRVSFLTRYDYMRRESLLPPAGSSLDRGTYNISRLTWGINFTLWRQSLLMFNHEMWFLPDPLKEINVWGVRYAITF
jgi:hypothetical protein